MTDVGLEVTVNFISAEEALTLAEHAIDDWGTSCAILVRFSSKLRCLVEASPQTSLGTLLMRREQACVLFL